MDSRRKLIFVSAVVLLVFSFFVLINVSKSMDTVAKENVEALTQSESEYINIVCLYELNSLCIAAEVNAIIPNRYYSPH